MWSKKSVLGAIVAFLGVLLLGVGSYFAGRHHGIYQGIDSYHNQCYTIGGFIIGDDGRVVQCAPVGQIPQEEVKKFKEPLTTI